MIGGMREHDGHPALAIHLAKLGDNESITIRTHGLSATTIVDAVAELRLMALGCRTSKPLLHTWASPSKNYSEADWENHRATLEAEFGLSGFPCVEIFHLKFGKGGRTAGHVHRVYLRVDVDGRAVRTGHSAIRQEKVSRIAEVMAGERLTSGRFNRPVIDRLRQEGLNDVADAMVRAGLAEATTAAAPRSAERAMTERLHDFAADEVWRRTAAAWRRSDNGGAFVAALAESGLRIGMGEKCAVAVSPGGAVHPLLRAINKGGERQHGRAIRKAELDTRLSGIAMPSVRDLLTVPDFDAGAFGITNLDRLPLWTVAADPARGIVRDEAEPGLVIELRHLTMQQEAALAQLEDAFHCSAADRAKAIREAIEVEVTQDLQRKRDEALRLRIETEKATWDRPSIGVSTWRDDYRAELADLPREYGPVIKWVDRLDAESSRVVLKTGTIVTLSPTRAWTDHTSPDTVAVMIAHALTRGWTSMTVTGSDDKWRQDIARAAMRAGLIVTDPDLRVVAEAELAQMQAEKVVETWQNCRAAFRNASPDARADAKVALLDTLERIAADPAIIERITDDGQRWRLIADLNAYEQYQARSGPPRLG